DGQEPWLARGAGRTLQQVSWEADPADHGGLRVELLRSPGVADRHRLSRHGREELALQELMGGRGRGGMEFLR
ncbi:unnamed protein product, partial [Ectocarpus sp. 6 AP-2014]